MPAKIAYTNGQKLGSLIFQEDRGSRNKHRIALFLCHCGNEFVTEVSSVVKLRVSSCGCLQRLGSKQANTKHGLYGSRVYRIWDKMKQRCYNPNNDRYKDYGGRGIVVCDEWRNNPQAFYNWAMANGYQDNLSIDRIDVYGNYEPSNCRWANSAIQAQNTRLLGSRNTSGFRGVKWNKNRGRWVAQISIEHKDIRIGSFVDPYDAALAYDRFIRFWGLLHPRNIIW